MNKDRQIIASLSPADLVALMNETGTIMIHEAGMSDGKPVVHAALKVVNAQTGEMLPGGLPFSVVMFKNPDEPGYTNIAIGTIVPAAELNVSLPRDYFNFANQRFRFSRVFPVDEGSFVIQMDLVLKNTTREYVKFNFGLWGALFSQILFELMGRGRESLIAAAQAYAEARTDFATHIAVAPVAADASEPQALMLEPDAIVPAAEMAEPVGVAEAVVEPVVEPVGEGAVTEAAAEIDAVGDAAVDGEAPVEDAAVEIEAPIADAMVEAVEDVPTPSEHTEITADPVEGKDHIEPVAEEPAVQLASVEGELPAHDEAHAEVELGSEAETKDVMPA